MHNVRLVHLACIFTDADHKHDWLLTAFLCSEIITNFNVVPDFCLFLQKILGSVTTKSHTFREQKYTSISFTQNPLQ